MVIVPPTRQKLSPSPYHLIFPTIICIDQAGRYSAPILCVNHSTMSSWIISHIGWLETLFWPFPRKGCWEPPPGKSRWPHICPKFQLYFCFISHHFSVFINPYLPSGHWEPTLGHKIGSQLTLSPSWSKIISPLNSWCTLPFEGIPYHFYLLISCRRLSMAGSLLQLYHTWNLHWPPYQWPPQQQTRPKNWLYVSIYLLFCVSHWHRYPCSHMYITWCWFCLFFATLSKSTPYPAPPPKSGCTAVNDGSYT